MYLLDSSIEVSDYRALLSQEEDNEEVAVIKHAYEQVWTYFLMTWHDSDEVASLQ